MFNLGRLEDRLNQDPAFRRKFLDDPAGVLRKEGLVLSRSQESALKAAVAKTKAVPGGADSLNRRTIGFTWFLK
jgi:hypothetical protein